MSDCDLCPRVSSFLSPFVLAGADEIVGSGKTDRYRLPTMTDAMTGTVLSERHPSVWKINAIGQVPFRGRVVSRKRRGLGANWLHATY